MTSAAEKLTPRQYQIATLASKGLSNKEIAQTLGLAEGTVKLHLHSIFAKLGIRRRVSLYDHV
jgi:DNA-binding NarL/FixJ family response regulator